MAMIAVQKGESATFCHPSTVAKARTILEFAPLLADDVASGMLSFGAVYREALYRKKVAMRMASGRHGPA